MPGKLMRTRASLRAKKRCPISSSMLWRRSFRLRMSSASSATIAAPTSCAGETPPKTAQRPRGARTGRKSMLRTKSGQQSRNAGAAVEPGRDREIMESRRSRRLREARAQPLDGCMLMPVERLRCSERAGQQSNTDQHTSWRNLWSSSTSSRISLGSCARCHWHSRRPACSCSPSGAAARAALIA